MPEDTEHVVSVLGHADDVMRIIAVAEKLGQLAMLILGVLTGRT